MLSSRFLLVCCILCSGYTLYADELRPEQFERRLRQTDSLLSVRSGHKGRLQLKAVCVKSRKVDFNFTGSLSNYPLRPGDDLLLREQLKSALNDIETGSADSVGYKVRNILCEDRDISELLVPALSYPANTAISTSAESAKYSPALVDRGISAPLGLCGRHIAMWQSHGRFFNNAAERWEWQRECLFQTVEDLYTQSYVVPLLAPMLENAGANVILPRERDCHTTEIIIDNDESEHSSCRIHGQFRTSGKWAPVQIGFKDTKAAYRDQDNPFQEGSSLKCECCAGAGACASWSACIPERGEYAVYVSYRSFSNSSTAANYIIHSLGADIPVKINQRMGCGTWIYLGTYEFDAGDQELVSLTNAGKGGVVSADAVKIGGGMGNMERGSDSTKFCTSGKPRFAEGARYWMQWSGIPSEVWSQNEGKNDYRDDLMSRGKWVGHLTGGSKVNPKGKGLRIPVDLTLAFHTDSYKSYQNRTTGTLSIYTLLCDASSKLPDGGSRSECRVLADCVQSQICSDIRAQWDSLWPRRPLWNRSYSESRTTPNPTVLLELLSHSTFEDMKYGLDPEFRFCISRACYKAILKFLAMQNHRPYVVQPLPVNSFSVRLSDDRTEADLKWKESVDELEPTATADYFILYTRIDDGGWDKGIPVPGNDKFSCKIALEKGHLYSFRIVACNRGGMSFPSEILCAGVPSDEAYMYEVPSDDFPQKIHIVNNFHRVSGPTWFDSDNYAGFDNRNDSGVPYILDWNFIGEQYSFSRGNPPYATPKTKFGSSYEDYADVVVAGNTFDYPYIHARILLKAGLAFDSSCAEAFAADSSLRRGCSVIDLICGKECRVKTATRSGVRGGVFTPELRQALSAATSAGCSILISGSYIASDSWEGVYPIFTEEADARKLSEERLFEKDILGYTLLRSHGSQFGQIQYLSHSVSFPAKPCRESYCVESPDALTGTCGNTSVICTYRDTGLPAGLMNDFGNYKVAAFGFPLEIISDKSVRDVIIGGTISDLFTTRP